MEAQDVMAKLMQTKRNTSLENLDGGLTLVSQWVPSSNRFPTIADSSLGSPVVGQFEYLGVSFAWVWAPLQTPSTRLDLQCETRSFRIPYQINPEFCGGS